MTRCEASADVLLGLDLASLTDEVPLDDWKQNEAIMKHEVASFVDFFVC